MLLINPVCSYRWMRPSSEAVESDQRSQKGMIAKKKKHLAIHILLPWEEQIAQLLHQGCSFRSMKYHKTFCVTWGELLNILPISLPKKKKDNCI